MVHSKLGEFIRTHRERIQPQDVGLPGHGRRRTPGLRREELAQLCDVSPTWLTWLEQGRPVSASSRMLARLADVMRLTAAERSYLFRLADKLDPAADADTGSPVGPMHAVVDAITHPAYVLNPQWDAIAWNRPAQALFIGWLGAQGGPQATMQPNLLRFMFLEPGARSLIVDWPDRAQRLVAEFRADCGKHADAEPLAGLIDTLSRQSEDFRQLWNSQHVVGRDGGARRFAHPEQGALTFEQLTFGLSTGRGVKLVMLLPASPAISGHASDEET